MNYRRHVALCREGWYFLFVLAFIIGGAVLREVNLLLVLSAMMISPLIFSWRLSMAMVNRLRVARRLPESARVGEPITVELTLVNQRKRLPCWAMITRDQWQARRRAEEPSTNGSRWAGALDVLIPYVPANGQANAAYQMIVHRRGRYSFGSIRVATRFPFGFLIAHVDLPCGGQLVVAPQIGRLTRQAAQVLGGKRWGHQPAHQRRGLMEADYYGLREWRPGDSRRWIHWRSSAKVGGLSVLQFEDQQKNDLTLVLDLWRPLSATPHDLQRVETAVSVMATIIAHECRGGRRALTLAVAGDPWGCWSGSASRRFGDDLSEILAEVSATPAPNLAGTARRLTEMQASGVTIVVSTRSLADAQHADSSQAAGVGSLVQYRSPLWLNVGTSDLDKFFQWTMEAGE